MKIRFADVTDSRLLLRIYSQYIDTAITFEYTLPTEEEFAKRILTITQDYPYLVCEETGQVVGYAYACRQMEREAYQWNAQLSIYVDKHFTSKGLGRILYHNLIEVLKLQGVKTVYGGVTIPNVKSEKLHLALGFKALGIYHNTGYKCNKWQDVTWFEKEIAPYNDDPAPFLPINKISKEKFELVLV